MKLRAWSLYLWNLWPPFLGAGISIVAVSPDLKSIRVRLKRRLWNRNLVGVHFGGSIYAMTDPFYMALLIANLGPDFVVWDKAAQIRFRKPGRTNLSAEFQLSDQDLNEIRARLQTEEKFDWERDVLVKDETGQVIAEVHKVISIRRSREVALKN